MRQARILQNVVGGSYESDDRKAGYSVSQNLYAEEVEKAGNGFYFTTSLRSVPGERKVLENFVVSDRYKQGCRGMFTASDGSVFAAFGDGIYRTRKNAITGRYDFEIISSYDVPSIGQVRFCETGGINSHVCWIDGSENIRAYPLSPEKATSAGFSLPLSFHTPLRQYRTADEVVNDINEHIRPSQICSLNGSLIINDPESDTWYYTDAYILGGTKYTREIYDLDEGGNVRYKPGSRYEVLTREVRLTDFDPSSNTSYIWLDRYSKPNFVTAEYSADKVTGMKVAGDFLYVFGTNSIQVYSQRTSTDAQGFTSMVFSSSGQNIREIGCGIIDSIQSVGNVIVFWGENGGGQRGVYSISGASVTRLSTNAMERSMDGKNLEGIRSLTYSENGHSFYCLKVPALARTFCYDFKTDQWHDRTTMDRKSNDGCWWAEYSAYSGGDILIAGSSEQCIAKLDKDKFDDYKGDPIVKRRITPAIINDHSPFMVNDVELVWNTGTTRDVTNENGAMDPVVMLEVSDDGGNIFSEEMWAYGGCAGSYSERTIWYGVGAMGTEIVFRFTITDRVPVVVTGAKIGFTVLNGV